MKKGYILPALLLCISLWGCGKAQETAVPTELTAVSVETSQETTEAPTELETTAVPTTQPPRIPGPERIEGNAVIIENVTVEYQDQLPHSILSGTTCRAYGDREKLTLNESQVYAAVRFRVTGKTAEEIEIADIHDDFMVELIYDDRFVYSSDSNTPCVFQSGSQVAVVSDMSSVGEVALAPLSAKEVTAYLPCAREVSQATDKNLIAVFTCNYSGYEILEFLIR